MHADLRRPRAACAALLLVVAALLGSTAAHSAVPHEDAVPAYAEEQTILQAEQGTPEPGWSDAASGRRHMDRHYLIPPGTMPEQNVILQRGGNTWRTLRNGPLAWWAAALWMLVPLGLLVAWAATRPDRHAPPDSGREVLRFDGWQRAVHWATALSFLALALTGLVMLYGKKLLLPWMGHGLFSWIALAGKYVHNVVGPLFILSSVLMFATFLRHNRFCKEDWAWVRRAGGLIGEGPAPAGYFNAGEKLWFWFGVAVLGLVMSITGLILDFPYLGEVGSAVGTTRYVQQWAHGLHLLGAAFYVAATLGHIYMGTLGTPGTYRGMRHGTVDEAWARKHHRLWYEDLQTRGAAAVAPPGEAIGPRGAAPGGMHPATRTGAPR